MKKTKNDFYPLHLRKAKGIRVNPAKYHDLIRTMYMNQTMPEAQYQ